MSVEELARMQFLNSGVLQCCVCKNIEQETSMKTSPSCSLVLPIVIMMSMLEM